MARRFWISLLAVVAAFGLVFATGAPARAEGTSGPAYRSYLAALTHSLAFPDTVPQGANDYSCKPNAAHPRPVVLVHGTWENRFVSWSWLAPQLKASGYCVFALNHGDDVSGVLGIPPALKGTADLHTSARELATFVDGVRSATGAPQVDLVGHSSGGPIESLYLKEAGGQGKVANVVTLGATNHGTTLSGLILLTDFLGISGEIGPLVGDSPVQQVRGSEFMRELYAGGDTVPGVAYTVVVTKYDEVATPPTSTFLTAGPGATVSNVVLQNGCPIDLSDHLSMLHSGRTLDIVRNALDPTHPVPLRCELRLPVI